MNCVAVFKSGAVSFLLDCIIQSVWIITGNVLAVYIAFADIHVISILFM